MKTLGGRSHKPAGGADKPELQTASWPRGRVPPSEKGGGDKEAPFDSGSPGTSAPAGGPVHDVLRFFFFHFEFCSFASCSVLMVTMWRVQQ